jgi:exonuclease I
MNTTFVFWDTETTGLDKAFHTPVEFGAVVTDANLRPIDNINISCRPPRFVLPEPWGVAQDQAINRRPAEPAAHGLQRNMPVLAKG